MTIKLESDLIAEIRYIDELLLNEANRLMAQLPTQKVAYAGEYVLPIVFEPQTKAGSYQLTASDRAAFDKSYVQLANARTLLSELYVAVN